MKIIKTYSNNLLIWFSLYERFRLMHETEIDADPCGEEVPIHAIVNDGFPELKANPFGIRICQVFSTCQSKDQKGNPDKMTFEVLLLPNISYSNRLLEHVLWPLSQWINFYRILLIWHQCLVRGHLYKSKLIGLSESLVENRNSKTLQLGSESDAKNNNLSMHIVWLWNIFYSILLLWWFKVKKISA